MPYSSRPLQSCFTQWFLLAFRVALYTCVVCLSAFHVVLYHPNPIASSNPLIVFCTYKPMATIIFIAFFCIPISARYIARRKKRKKKKRQTPPPPNPSYPKSHYNSTLTISSVLCVFLNHILTQFVWSHRSKFMAYRHVTRPKNKIHSFIHNSWV